MFVYSKQGELVNHILIWAPNSNNYNVSDYFIGNILIFEVWEEK
jgi:hypothetical protein